MQHMPTCILKARCNWFGDVGVAFQQPECALLDKPGVLHQQHMLMIKCFLLSAVASTSHNKAPPATQDDSDHASDEPGLQVGFA